MRKSLTILLTVAALGFLASCGASGGSDAAPSADKGTATTTATTEAPKATTTTTEASDAVPVADWADSFCASFGTWLDDIKGASNGVADDITPGDTQAAKVAIVRLFGSASEITQTLVSDLEDNGYPDIDNGDQLVTDLIEKFDAFDTAAQAAQTDAGELPTDDTAAFQSQAKELTSRFQDEVNTVADTFAEIDKDYPDQEFQSALSSACNF